MRLTRLKEEIERVNLEIQSAERDYDLNRAAELKYGTLLELQKQLKEAEEMLEKEVGAADGSGRVCPAHWLAAQCVVASACMAPWSKDSGKEEGGRPYPETLALVRPPAIVSAEFVGVSRNLALCI